MFLVFDALDECSQEGQRRIPLPLSKSIVKDSFIIFLTSQLHPGDMKGDLYDVLKIELSATRGLRYQKDRREPLRLNCLVVC